MRAEWNDLLARSGQENPFLSHEWLTAWWCVYGNGARLHVVISRDRSNGRLEGALPAIIRQSPKGVGFRYLVFMGSESVSSDFLTCLASRDREREVYDEIVRNLRMKDSLWDRAVFSDLEEKGLFHRCLEICGWEGLSFHRTYACPYIQLPPLWEEFLGSLQPKVRSRIGYYRRALDRTGEVAVRKIVREEEVDAALNDLIRLREDRFRQKGLRNVNVPVYYRMFHRLVNRSFLQNDWLRLYFLDVDGRPVAFLLQYIYGKRAFFYQTGFDGKWAKNSVGFVLLGYVIQETIREKIRAFEFLRGDETYKYEWGKVADHQLINVSVFSCTLRGRICKTYCLSIYHMRERFKKFLVYTGLRKQNIC
ncbi:MAG: GNAT family N-acetyltransferase [Syntrophales bacterium]